jgi:hypothetical protein
MMEGQANQFAAHLLIPRQAFTEQAKRIGWGDIAKLVTSIADLFEVSIQVSIQQSARLADFPCIALLFSSSEGTLRTPVYSRYFTETGLFYPKNQDAPSGTLAAKLLANNAMEQVGKKHYSDASTWFPNALDWRAEKFAVNETSFKLGTYGAASFLEIIALDNW